MDRSLGGVAQATIYPDMKPELRLPVWGFAASRFICIQNVARQADPGINHSLYPTMLVEA